MTPLAGFVIAVIAGWIVRDPRRAAAIVVVPYLAVVAVQTWALADGRGVSPPDTVWPVKQAIGYYVVQVIILALALGVAALLAAVRARRVASPDGAAGIDRRTAIAVVVDAVLTIAFIVGALLDSAPVRHHSTQGSPPVQGLLGIGACIVSLIVLSVLTIRGRRAVARAKPAGSAVPARRPQVTGQPRHGH
jgi:hypothetical protein